MRHFFSSFGWLICLVLTVILTGTILSLFFPAVIVVVCLVALTMILGLGIVLWLFRRFFVNLILLCILFVTLTSLLYTTGIFNGYVDVAFKGLEIKENVKVGGDVIVDGNVVVNKDVEVKGNTILQDVIAGNVTVKDVITGNVTSENVTINKDVNVKGNVTVDKDVTVKGNVVVEKDVTVKGNVNVEKDVNIKGDVNVGGDINIDGKINIPNNPCPTPTPKPTPPVVTPPVVTPPVVTPPVVTPPVVTPPVVTPAVVTPPVVVPPVVVPPADVTARITWGDHIDGATEIFGSVVLSGSATPNIESNLSYSIVKISSTVYHVRITISEGSHGTAVISVSGSGITTNQVTRSY